MLLTLMCIILSLSIDLYFCDKLYLEKAVEKPSQSHDYDLFISVLRRIVVHKCHFRHRWKITPFLRHLIHKWSFQTRKFLLNNNNYYCVTVNTKKP